MRLTKLSVPEVKLDASIAGQETVVAIAGGGQFADGALNAEIAAERTKPQGGRLFLKTAYSNETRQLDLDLDFQEPKDGLVTTMLDLPGRPPLAFTIKGSGPVENFAADIALSADNEKLLSGRTTIRQGEAGLDFAANLSGTLTRLVPPAYADFFAGTSTLDFKTRRLPDGGFSIDEAAIRSGVLALGLTGALSPDGFPTRIEASGRLAAEGGKPILLPGAGGATIVETSFSAKLAEGGWSADAKLASLVSGAVEAAEATLSASGAAENLADPAKRRLTFDVSGRAGGLTAEDPALARALGDSLDLAAKGSWQAGNPVAIDEIRFGNANATARFVGRLDGNTLDGTYTIAAPDLSALAGLVGSDLAGGVDLAATGTVALVGGAFSLDLDGTSKDLETGMAAVDPLLAGTVKLTGGVTRNPDGLAIRALQLAGPALTAKVDGQYGTRQVGLKAEVDLPDVALLTDRAAGAARLTASLDGPAEAPSIAADFSAPRLALQGKALTNAVGRFTGTLPASGPNGTVSLDARLDGVPVTAAATIASAADGALSVTGLEARAGAARVSGDVRLAADRLASGRLQADIPNLAEVAPLLLLRGEGAVAGTVDLSAENGRQNATIAATANRLRVETVAVRSAKLDLTGRDITGVPALDGTAKAEGVAIGGFVLTTLDAKATTAPAGGTAFSAQATMPRGRIATAGALSPSEGGFDLTLDRLDLSQSGLSAALAAPVTVASRPDGVTIPKAELRLAKGGAVRVAGMVGDRLALDIGIDRLPAALANLASPDLGATGSLSGEAKLTGTMAAPQASFSIKGDGLSVAAAKAAGVPALALTASGSFARDIVTIDARAEGAGGLSVTAAGKVPLAGPGLDLSVKGRAPLSLANLALRERGTRLTGTATLDARVGGSLAKPRLEGGVAIAGGSVNDPDSGMMLSGLAGQARFSGDRLTIERLSAATPNKGTLALSGSMALSGDFAADLTLALRRARVSDGEVLVAVLSGDLTIRGPVMRRPTIAGRIRVERAEITIPERFAQNAALLGVKHIDPPPEVRRTLARVKRSEPSAAGGGRAFDLLLDIAIDAPGRVFVRGRGVDAELAGQLRLTGPASAVVPVGAFTLRRGSINVIGQHIELDRGEVRLEGDLDPSIDFSATSRARSIVVTARLTGRASDPQIILSSVPELPQDEVLAQFLFGHSISDLSPLQIVQLATAVAQLAGGQGGDLLGNIRKSTGLDNLSFTTDRQGNAAVQAGRYVAKNVYFGVTTGATGQTNATVNLDITRNLKARVEAGTEGTGGGIYYEREY